MKYLYTSCLAFFILLQNQSFVFDSISTLELPLQEESFIAVIEVIESDGKFEFLGKFINNSDIEIIIDYEMKTDKISKSGSSLSKQSGKKKCGPNTEIILTKVGLNIDNKTNYCAVLRVFLDDEMIATDSLNYAP